MAGERRKHCASLSIHSRTGTSKACASGTDRGQANVNEPEVHCCATVAVRKTDSGTKLTFYPNHSGHSPTSDPFSVLPKSDMCTDFVRAKLLAGLSVKDVLREWRKLLRDPAVRSCGVFAPWDGGLSDMDVRNILASMVPQRKCVLHTVVALCDAQLHAAVTRASLLLGLQAGCLRHRADSHKSGAAAAAIPAWHMPHPLLQTNPSMQRGRWRAWTRTQGLLHCVPGSFPAW